MSSRRVQKFAEAIREVVSMAIIADLKDPRIQNVTVTFVEVSADLRQAKVHVSVMGDETQQRLSLSGLRSAAGYLQSKVADRIDARYTPRIEFILDMGVKNSLEIARILREVLPATPPAEAAEFEQDDGQRQDDDAQDDENDTDDEDDESEDDEDAELNETRDGDERKPLG